MNTEMTPQQKKKTPVFFWILLALGGAMIVGLLVWAVLNPSRVVIGSDDESGSTKQSTVSQQAPGEEYKSIGDTVRLGEWVVTLESASFESKVPAGEILEHSPEKGSLFYVIKMHIKNEGTEPGEFLSTFSTDQIRLEYAEKYKYSASYLLGSDDLHDVTLNPMQEKDGLVAFEMPENVSEDDKPIVLVFRQDHDEVKVKLR